MNMKLCRNCRYKYLTRKPLKRMSFVVKQLKYPKYWCYLTPCNIVMVINYYLFQSLGWKQTQVLLNRFLRPFEAKLLFLIDWLNCVSLVVTSDGTAIPALRSTFMIYFPLSRNTTDLESRLEKTQLLEGLVCRLIPPFIVLKAFSFLREL